MSTTFKQQFVTNVERAHSHVMWDDSESDIHVVIWPTWGGLSQFEKDFAEDIAHWGHAATAVDLYGTGNNPTELQDKMDTMNLLVSDKASLNQLQSDITQEIAKAHPDKKLVHVGFCLGGRLAIEAGLHLPSTHGAASFHGLMSFFRADTPEQANRDAQFLICNGYLDPMVDVESADNARAYFDELGVDWQFIDFGQAHHSFMLPGVDAPADGHAFSPKANARGRHYLQFFLEQLSR